MSLYRGRENRDLLSGENLLITVFAFIVIAAVLLVVGYPLWLKRRGASYLHRGERNEGGDLTFRKESLYATIKELDFDFKTGKLSAEDYEELRKKYREKAMALLHEMEKSGLSGEIDDRIEEEIRARRRQVAEKSQVEGAEARGDTGGGIYCPGCGEGCPPGDSFCPYCGAELPASD